MLDWWIGFLVMGIILTSFWLYACYQVNKLVKGLPLTAWEKFRLYNPAAILYLVLFLYIAKQVSNALEDAEKEGC